MTMLYSVAVEKMKNINISVIERIFCSQRDKFKAGSCSYIISKKGNTEFIIKRFECFLRIYVNENIAVSLGTNTVNSKSCIMYDYFSYDPQAKIDLKKYKAVTRAVFKYLISEAFIMPYSPECRKEIMPSNVRKKELINNSWRNIWESRFLEVHDFYREEELIEWIDRCTDNKIQCERILI